MEIEIEKRRENNLLEREEISAMVTYEGATPTRIKMKEELKKNLALGGFIVIGKIESFYGIKKTRVYAKVYPSEEIAKKIEETYILNRDQTGKKGEDKEKKEDTKKEDIKTEKKEGVKSEQKEKEEILDKNEGKVEETNKKEKGEVKNE